MPTITLRGDTKDTTDSIHFSVKEGKSVLPDKLGQEGITTITLSGDFPDSTSSRTIQRKASLFEDSNTY